MSIGAINVDILPYVVYGMPTFSSSSSVAFFRQKRQITEVEITGKRKKSAWIRGKSQ